MKTKNLLTFALIVLLTFFLKRTFAGLETYNRALPNSVTFQVVVKTTKELPPGLLKNFNLIQKEIRMDGSLSYHLGQFKKIKTAEMYKQIIGNQGFENVFVYGYFQKRRISLEDAITLAENHNSYDMVYGTIKTETMSVEELNALLDLLNYKKQLYFTVIADKNVSSKTIEIMKKEQYFSSIEGESGQTYFTSGKFLTYEQAVAYRKQIIKNGGENTVVAAFINNKRVPTEKAIAYCEKILAKTLVYNDN